MADSSSQPRALYLLDGMALAYRAYFALIRNPIRTTAGVNTSALFGFANVLEDLREKRQPSHLAVVWDTSAPTFRHQLYAEYKAQRDAMPEDLAESIPQIKRWVQALDLPSLECDGWEADDVIASLAAQAQEAGCERVWMVTPDKDFGQLVTDCIKIWRPGRKGSEAEEWGIEEVCERWNIASPKLVQDMIGLMGDASDNIPGVAGVGEKTAAKLLAAHGDIEGVLRAAEAGEIKGKLGEKVLAGAEMARLSHELAIIKTDAPVELDWQALALGEPKREELQSLCVEFEFNALGKRILGAEFHAGRGAAQAQQASQELSASQLDSTQQSEPTQASAPSQELLFAEERRLDLEAVDYGLIAELEEMGRYLHGLSAEAQVAFDTETDALKPRRAKLLGVSFASAKGVARFLALPEAGAKRESALALLKAFFADFEGTLIAHNAKFDLAVLHALGIELGSAKLVDTMVLAGLLDITQRRSLDFLSESLLGYRPVSYAELTGSSKVAEQKPLAELLAEDPEKVSNYACEDADLAWQLAELLWPKVQAEQELSNLWQQVEQPLTAVLMRMEAEGIRLDATALDEVRAELGQKIEQIEREIRSIAGEEINLKSPKQLGVFLFDKLRLVEKPKKTKTGQYVTNEQVLSSLAAEHEIVAQILQFREATKLKNTYVDPLPEDIDPVDGRIHTNYQQLAATTGRLASSDPNLQNIPIRTELGRSVRRAFVARGEEFVLLACDYSQIELRVMAHISGDEALREAFRSNQDIHTATAAKVYGVEADAVLPEMRRAAKMVNFGIIYGISAFGLSQRLKVSRAEASNLIEGYWQSYPQVKEFMRRVVEESKARGYGETLLGRRCPMPDLSSRNAMVRGNAERFAINMPIQGTAADLIKLAMVQIDALLREGGYQSKLLLQVHDELVFDLHREEEGELRPKLVAAMEQVVDLSVPLQVDSGLGENWLQAH